MRHSVPKVKHAPARIGIYGVGHHTYWHQFDTLLPALQEKLARFQRYVEDQGDEVFNFGISDNAGTAYAAVEKIIAADLDLLFVDMLTYATSSTIAVVFREINIPIVLVALQPDAALDYNQANTQLQLYNDDICALPEFTSVALRFGRPIPPIVIGVESENDPAYGEIRDFCRIARVLRSLKRARIGQLGHVLEAMLDMHTDPTLLTRTFGCHIVQTEPDEIFTFYQNVQESEVRAYETRILDFFDTPEPKGDPVTRKLTDADLKEAARAGIALEAFIEQKKLDGLAYYYEATEGSELRRLVSNLIVGNSLLTASGFPMCGELDLKTCIAMMIMDRLGMGGSFAEFHPVDFKEGFVLVGHDGPHHLAIAHGKPVLRSLIKYHGKPGSGASVEFKIKEGPITMLGLTQKADGQFKFVIAEGESVAGPVPPTGNTNTRGFFKPDVRTFLKRWFAEGPTHHFALGIGHQASVIQTLGEFLNIESKIVS